MKKELKYKIFEYADGTFKISDNLCKHPYGYTFKSYDDAVKKIGEFKKQQEENKVKPLRVYDVD